MVFVLWLVVLRLCVSLVRWLVMVWVIWVDLCEGLRLSGLS